MATVADAEQLLREFSADQDNCVGGSLHIVLEDLNLEDEHITFCIGQARSEGDDIGARLGELMLAMPQEQRRQTVNRWDELAPRC